MANTCARIVAADLAALARAELVRAGAQRGAAVVVGVSGGADSAALALATVRAANDLDVRVVAAHYDHGLRSTSSRAAERAIVQRQAESLGIELHQGAAPPGQLQRLHSASGRSLEELAREHRYAFLLAVVRTHEAICVLVGHHRDDDLETILMRALQGSLQAGGIPRRSGLVLRPLLGVRRAVLRAYAQDGGLPLLDDPTNADQRILRNRLRGLIPALERAVPGAADNLPLFARTAADGWRHLQEQAQRMLPWRFEPGSEHGARYSIAGRSFWHAPPPVRLAALYRACDALVSNGAVGRHGRLRLSRRFLQPLLGLRPPDKRLELVGHGVRVVSVPAVVTVSRSFPPHGPGQSPVVLRGQNRYLIAIGAAPTAGAADYDIRGTGWYAHVAPAGDQRAGTITVRGSQFPIVLRSRRPGDSIRTAAGTKRLRLLFSEWHVLPQERWRIPVLTDRDGVFGVAGEIAGAKNITREWEQAEGREAGGRSYVIEFVTTAPASSGKSPGRDRE